MTHLFNTQFHKNQVEEEHHACKKTTTTPDYFSPLSQSAYVSPVDDEPAISNCNKTPHCSSSFSSESTKKDAAAIPAMGSNNKSLDHDSSGKRKSTDGEEDEEDSIINIKKMKTTPSSPQSPTPGINNDSFVKMLGPLHLPDFKNRHEIDLHLLRLKSELASTNSQLVKTHSKKPSSSSSLLPLTARRQHIISDLIRENPTFNLHNPTSHLKFCKKIYIPVQKYPNHNFIGPIIGPRGQTQKRMQRETGAKINVRGRGSSRSQQHDHIHPDSSDDLHVYIEAETQDSLDSAAAMVERFLLLPQQPEETPEVNQNTEKKKTKKKEKMEVEATSIYVANLPQGVEESELQRLFSGYGDINSTRVMRDRCTGCSRGYGFVNFERYEGAAMAVKMLNGKSMGGKVMVVRMAEVKNAVFQEKKGMAGVTPEQQQKLSLSSQGLVFQSRMFVPFPQVCSRKGPCWYYETGGSGTSSLSSYHHQHRVHNILPYSFYAPPVNPSFPHPSNY